MGGRTNIFPGMKPLKTFYILLKQEEPKGCLHFFYARSITCTLQFSFVNGNKMFYIFASFKQIWVTKYTRFVEVNVESEREWKKQKQKQNKTKN